MKVLTSGLAHVNPDGLSGWRPRDPSLSDGWRQQVIWLSGAVYGVHTLGIFLIQNNFSTYCFGVHLSLTLSLLLSR